MYEIFEKLLKEHNTTAYKVGKATGIAGSTFSDWKNGRSVPGLDKMIKISDFFGVSVEYLKTGKETIDKFSDENAKLVAKIRTDKRLNEIITQYLASTDEEKNKIYDVCMILTNKI